MAIITDFASLKEEIQSKLARSDITVLDNLEAYIKYAEADFNKKLRVRDMLSEPSPQLVTVGGVATVALPTDFLQVETIALESDPRTLDFVTPQNLITINAGRNDTTGRPTVYTIVSGGRLKFGPIPDTDYNIEMEYYQKVPALTVSTQETNWLLDDTPLLYLYRSLYHAFNQLRDADNANRYGQLSVDIMGNMNEVNDDNETGTSGMQIRAIGNGP